VGEQIKWGILGNSTIGRRCVIPAIQKSRNGVVHALASRSSAQAEQVASKNRIYDSYDAVLTDPAVEAVYIPLPNHLHHPWTLKALRAGKHVLCEKPLACNVRQAQEMAEAADEANLMLMEAFMYRFHPRSRGIKKMIKDGAIGPPCLVRAAFCYHLDPNVLETGDNARLKPEMGGGTLLDVGCYCVSVARWLLDAEPAKLQAQAMYHDKGVDLHVVGSLFFPENTFATFEASFISALQQTYSVVGKKGAIELPHDAFIPWEKDAMFTLREKDQEVGTEHVINGADEYQLMVEHFAEAVLGNAELGFSTEDSICNMRVLDALADAAKTGDTVRV